jgi:hypothetical protein
LQRALQHYYSLIILLIGVLLVSCSPKQEVEKGGIDGEILNTKTGLVFLTESISPFESACGKFPAKQTFKLDSLDVFFHQQDFDEGYYTFEADEVTLPVYFVPGKKLSIDLDVRKPYEKPSFGGGMKYEARYLFDRKRELARIQLQSKTAISFSEQQYVSWVTSFRSALDSILLLYITNHPRGSKTFMEQESVSNYYLAATYLESYPRLHALAVDSLSFKPSPSFYNQLDEIEYPNDQASDNAQYVEYVLTRIHERTFSQKMTDSKTYWLEQKLSEAENTLIDTTIYNVALFNMAREMMSMEPSAKRDLLYSRARGLISSRAVRENLPDTIPNLISEP